MKILPSLVFDQPTNLNHWESSDHYSHSHSPSCKYFIPLLFCFTYHQQIPSLKNLAISTSPSFFLSSLITTIWQILTFSSSFLNLSIGLLFSAIALFPTSLEYPAVFIQVSRIILPLLFWPVAKLTLSRSCGNRWDFSGDQSFIAILPPIYSSSPRVAIPVESLKICVFPKSSLNLCHRGLQLIPNDRNKLTVALSVLKS